MKPSLPRLVLRFHGEMTGRLDVAGVSVALAGRAPESVLEQARDLVGRRWGSEGTFAALAFAAGTDQPSEHVEVFTI